MTGYAPQMLTHAKSLRRDMTDAERKLWKILRDRQLHAAKFRRQQPVSPYIADFVYQDVRLIVEIDGGQQNDNAYDRRRDTWLNEAGYRVLRLWNNEVLENIDGVAARIIVAARGRTNYGSADSSGRRQDGGCVRGDGVARLEREFGR